MENIDIVLETQRLNEHLEEAWQDLREVAPPRRLTEISQFVDGLNEPYQSGARNWIAKYMVSAVGLFILSRMTALPENSEEFLPRICEHFGQISRSITVRSLEDLVLLGSAIDELLKPSQSATPSLLADMVEMYYHKLRQACLLLGQEQVQLDDLHESTVENENPFLQAQRLTEQLEHTWQSLQAMAIPQGLTEISQFVNCLAEPLQSETRSWIAKYMARTMGPHVLSLMVTLRDHAVEEDILPGDCLEVYEDVFPETLAALDKLDRTLRIRSFANLVVLGCITDGLVGLSRPRTATSAQSWLYGLAEMMYYGRLKEVHLIADDEEEMSCPPFATKASGLGEKLVTFAPEAVTHQNGANGNGYNGCNGAQAIHSNEKVVTQV